MSCREKIHDFKIGTNFSSKHSKIQNQLEIVLFGSKRLQFKSKCVCVKEMGDRITAIKYVFSYFESYQR